MRERQDIIRPILPGRDYKYGNSLNFHKCQTLKFFNGIPVQKEPTQGIGGERLLKSLILTNRDDIEEIKYETNGLDSDRDGQTREKAPPPFIPKFCFLDKKILRFFAYFEESVTLDGKTNIKRIRYVEIHYYLVDDTISVLEPKLQNSGLNQGTILKRHRIPRTDGDEWENFWHWTDFNLGTKPIFYSKEYVITNCDKFTRLYLEEEGVKVEPFLEAPKDSYVNNRHKIDYPNENINKLIITSPKLNRYIKNDLEVLRFYATSRLPSYPLGQKENQKYIIYFYLSDHSIEIRENRNTLDSKEPFGKFLSRKCIQKHFDGHKFECMPSENRSSRTFYSPEDFQIGEEIEILKKRFYIYDVDAYTSKFYRDKYGIKMSMNQTNTKNNPNGKKVMTNYPPRTGVQIGTPEDTLQNCVRLIPKPPKKDIKNIIDNLGKTLRFEGILHSAWPSDTKRKFVFTYYLSDNTVSIFEFCPPNSGRKSGKYLERTRLIKTQKKIDGEVDYYNLSDFYIGARLNIYTRQFEITDADKRILQFIEENECKLEKTWINTYRQYFLLQK